jgi:hypothetical protein
MSERPVPTIQTASRGKLLAFIVRPGMAQKFPKHVEAAAREYDRIAREERQREMRMAA